MCDKPKGIRQKKSQLSQWSEGYPLLSLAPFVVLLPPAICLHWDDPNWEALISSYYCLSLWFILCPSQSALSV